MTPVSVTAFWLLRMVAVLPLKVPEPDAASEMPVSVVTLPGFPLPSCA